MTLKDQLVGVWSLVATEFHGPDGAQVDLFGAQASGMLSYGAGGQMAVQIMRAGRPAFASGDFRKAGADEARAAVEGYLAYFGTYEVDEAEASVTHHMQGSLFPNWVGQDLKRFCELAGDRLTLSVPPLLAGGQASSGVLVWQRVE